MWLPLLAVAGGLVVLAFSADRFVLGASALARRVGVSPLLIGLTVVAFGTSAPEVVVSVLAAMQGNPGLAIGNALGSNIANIGLVLGASALIAPLAVSSTTLRREFPILLGVSLLGLVLLINGHLGRLDGLLLLTGLVVFAAWLIAQGLRNRDPGDHLALDIERELPVEVSLTRSLLWLAMGLVLLLVSSRALVWGAVEIATALGVSDLVIGLTIVAVGTSLPELATSVAAAWKGETDLAIGNIIGSNLFNLLCVLAIPAILAPSAVEMGVLIRDYPVMLGLTVLLYLMAMGLRGPGRVRRWEGAVLLSLFAGYLFLLGATAGAWQS